MKQASPQLIALLASRQFFSADLYQFDLANGNVAETSLYYTGGDQDIIWNNITWKSGSTGNNSGPFFDGSRSFSLGQVGIRAVFAL